MFLDDGSATRPVAEPSAHIRFVANVYRQMFNALTMEGFSASQALTIMEFSYARPCGGDA